ncbi:GDSL-type esterase/lipase family protein (plasmid) [Streptomycetaceae bacterium NBC_01309]
MSIPWGMGGRGRLFRLAVVCLTLLGVLGTVAYDLGRRTAGASAATAGSPGDGEDLVWTTAGDERGFHLLVARGRDGHVWRTLASLSEPGLEADLWIGNACLTASGRRLVVVYAPRSFTNRAELFLRGGFTAVVDTETGAVLKLPVQSALAYYNPGCGAGEDAVLTQAGDEDLGRTRLIPVRTAAGTLGTPVVTPGQVTSAVPTPDGIVAASGERVVRLDRDGTQRTLARSTGTPVDLHPDAQGGVWFMDHTDDRARVRRHHAGATQSYALGRTGEVGISAGGNGTVFLTGSAPERPRQAAEPGRRPAALPPTAKALAAPAGATVSTTGTVAVTGTAPTAQTDPTRGTRITLLTTATGRQDGTVVSPAPPLRPAEGRTLSPNLVHRGPDAQSRTTGSPHDPIDPDHSCSVPRGDVRTQVYQPTVHQIEWAVDMLAQGALDLRRPANWKGSGLPAYRPVDMFPPIPLTGGGDIPAQILLGITAQESNMWQASRHTVEGLAGNPLIGNYYGIPSKLANQESEWDVDWGHADCGYGVTQVTDGMRRPGMTKPGETALPPEQQRAIAVDYAANITAGAQILAAKWNQLAAAGMRVNDGDPARIENWFMAVWAYNSGFHPKQAEGQPWGLGWTNNPANAHYPWTRKAFLDGSPGDAARPQEWPYPEKVMGWAAHSIGKPGGRGGVGFQPAYWNGSDGGVANRWLVKPPTNLFCTVRDNDCDPTREFVPDDPSVLPTRPGEKPEPPSHCGHVNPATGKYDLKCWWHSPAEWKLNCQYECGNEKIRFDAGVHANPPDVSVHQVNCQTEDLPRDVLVVDDVPADVPAVTPTPCPRRSDGTFTLDFAKDGKTGDYLSKVDLHQVGGGFGGHFWFTHTREGGPPESTGERLKVTGRWEPNRPLHGWVRVMVHMPNHGAHTQQAAYTVHTADGPERRTLLQRIEENRWVPLGAFRFDGVPRVELTSIAGASPDGTEDIAFDAVAFQPLPGKPKHQVVVLGDSFASGEGASPVSGAKYYPESDRMGRTGYQNACHRSTAAWSRKTRLPDTTVPLGTRADTWDPAVDFHIASCSGARTQMLLPVARPGEEPVRNAFGYPAEGQYLEPPQLEKGFVDTDTTLVLLSIGGNDAGFSDVLARCAQTSDCHKIPDFDRTLRERISLKVVPSVRTVLTQISQAAPHAKIVLMGYPKLFSGVCRTTTQPEQSGAANPHTQGDVDWLGDLAKYLRENALRMIDDLRTGVNGIDVHYTDPIPAFEGRGVCGNPESVNAFIEQLTPGEGDIEGPGPAHSQQSYHPNELGTTLLGDVLTGDLPRFGYTGGQ